jgi:hypothetical protein
MRSQRASFISYCALVSLIATGSIWSYGLLFKKPKVQQHTTFQILNRDTQVRPTSTMTTLMYSDPDQRALRPVLGDRCSIEPWYYSNVRVTTAAAFDYSFQCMHVEISSQRPCPALRCANSGETRVAPARGELRSNLPETCPSKAVHLHCFILDNTPSSTYLPRHEITLDIRINISTCR